MLWNIHTKIGLLFKIISFWSSLKREIYSLEFDNEEAAVEGVTVTCS